MQANSGVWTLAGRQATGRSGHRVDVRPNHLERFRLLPDYESVPGAVKVLPFELVDSPPEAHHSDFRSARSRPSTMPFARARRPVVPTCRTAISRRVLALEERRTGDQAVPAPSSSCALRPGGLSTGASDCADFPDGITVAPGNRIDVTEECDNPIDASGNGGCTLVPGTDTKAAAKFGNVKLASNNVWVSRCSRSPISRIVVGCLGLL